MKYILIFSLLIAQTILPAKAASNTTYIIYGNMPNIILLQMDSDKHITVTALPTTLILKAACTNHSTSLTTLIEPKTQTCLVHTIQSSFDISIDHTIYLNTKTLDATFPQHLEASDLVDMDTIASYFHTLSSKVDISFLWTYQNYITSDLSLWDIKDLFPIFISDQVDIKYQYPHMIGDREHWYILDKQFDYNP